MLILLLTAKPCIGLHRSLSINHVFMSNDQFPLRTKRKLLQPFVSDIHCSPQSKSFDPSPSLKQLWLVLIPKLVWIITIIEVFCNHQQNLWNHMQIKNFNKLYIEINIIYYLFRSAVRISKSWTYTVGEKNHGRDFLRHVSKTMFGETIQQSTVL